MTPFAIVMFGETVPLYSRYPAPLAPVPTPKCVIAAPGDAVHSPKSMLATGLTLPDVTVHAPAVRTTLTRA